MPATVFDELVEEQHQAPAPAAPPVPPPSTNIFDEEVQARPPTLPDPWKDPLDRVLPTPPYAGASLRPLTQEKRLRMQPFALQYPDGRTTYTTLPLIVPGVPNREALAALDANGMYEHRPTREQIEWAHEYWQSMLAQGGVTLPFTEDEQALPSLARGIQRQEGALLAAGIDRPAWQAFNDLSPTEKQRYQAHHGASFLPAFLPVTPPPSQAPLPSGVPLEGYLGPQKTARGDHATVMMITVTDPRLNNGRATNIPLLVPGQVDLPALLQGQRPTAQQQDVAITHALTRVTQGEQIPAYDSIADAEQAARQESDERGRRLARQQTLAHLPQTPRQTREVQEALGTAPLRQPSYGLTADEMAENLMTGVRQGTAAAAHTLGNIPWLARRLAEGPLGQAITRVTGLPQGGAVNAALEQGLRQVEAAIKVDPGLLASRERFADHLFQAIGAAAPGLATAYGAVALGGPIVGLAGLGALSQADQGLWAAAAEGTRQALLGGILKWTRTLPLAERLPITGATFGGMTLAAGGSVQDAAIQTLIGMGLAIPGEEPGRGVREQIGRFDDWLRDQEARRGIPPGGGPRRPSGGAGGVPRRPSGGAGRVTPTPKEATLFSEPQLILAYRRAMEWYEQGLDYAAVKAGLQRDFGLDADYAVHIALMGHETWTTARQARQQQDATPPRPTPPPPAAGPPPAPGVPPPPQPPPTAPSGPVRVPGAPEAPSAAAAAVPPPTPGALPSPPPPRVGITRPVPTRPDVIAAPSLTPPGALPSPPPPRVGSTPPVPPRPGVIPLPAGTPPAAFEPLPAPTETPGVGRITVDITPPPTPTDTRLVHGDAVTYAEATALRDTAQRNATRWQDRAARAQDPESKRTYTNLATQATRQLEQYETLLQQWETLPQPEAPAATPTPTAAPPAPETPPTPVTPAEGPPPAPPSVVPPLPPLTPTPVTPTSVPEAQQAVRDAFAAEDAAAQAWQQAQTALQGVTNPIFRHAYVDAVEQAEARYNAAVDARHAAEQALTRAEDAAAAQGTVPPTPAAPSPVPPVAPPSPTPAPSPPPLTAQEELKNLTPAELEQRLRDRLRQGGQAPAAPTVPPAPTPPPVPTVAAWPPGTPVTFQRNGRTWQGTVADNGYTSTTPEDHVFVIVQPLPGVTTQPIKTWVAVHDLQRSGAEAPAVAPQSPEPTGPVPPPTPMFKEGDRVQFTGRQGETLSGTVMSPLRPGEAVEVQVDQTPVAGGRLPIGRVEYRRPEGLTRLEDTAPTPPTDVIPPPPAPGTETTPLAPEPRPYTLTESDRWVDVVFPDKPSEAVRKALKDQGFRWYKPINGWRARKTPLRTQQARTFLERYYPETHPPAETVTPEATPTPTAAPTPQATTQGFQQGGRGAVLPEHPPAPTEPPSWKVGAKNTRDTRWAYNALRFATQTDAQAYANDLGSRWMGADQIEVHPADEAPTHRWDPTTGAVRLPDEPTGPPATSAYVPPDAQVPLFRPTYADADAMKTAAYRMSQRVIETENSGPTPEEDAAMAAEVRDVRARIARYQRELPTPTTGEERYLRSQLQEADRRLAYQERRLAGLRSLADDPPLVDLAKRITDVIGTRKLRTIADLQKLADAAYGRPGGRAAGVYTTDDLYDALEMGVNLYVLHADEGRFDPTQDLVSALETIDDLETIRNSLPTKSVRTRETDTYQQFSTPPAYAYVANWVANLQSSDVVLEPSAGTGSLATFAARGVGINQVMVNEIAPRRLDVLEQLGFPVVTHEDAMFLHAIQTQQRQPRPSVVVMNPPFSWAVKQGQKNNFTGARHVEEALKLLQPGGRLVAIVGRGMALDSPTFADWWTRLQQQYTVRANLLVPGELYRKQGTTFDTRVLVIDKGPATTPGTVLTGEVASLRDLATQLYEVRHVRPQRDPAGAPAGEPPPAEPGGESPSAPGAGGDGPAPDVRPPTSPVGPGERPGAAPGPPGAGEPGGGAPPPVGAPGGAPVPPPQPRGRRPAGGGRRPVTGRAPAGGGPPGGVPGPAPTPPRPDAGAGAGVPAPEVSVSGGPDYFDADSIAAIEDILGTGGVGEEVTPYGNLTPAVDPGKYARLKPIFDGLLTKAEAAGRGVDGFLDDLVTRFGEPIIPFVLQYHADLRRPAEPSDSQFSVYTPQRVTIPGSRPHPDPLVESLAMAAVLPPTPTYTPHLDPGVITTGALSLPQLESVTYAGQAHAQFLPTAAGQTPQRQGFFVGDACVAAGTRIYNPLTGKHTPIEILLARQTPHVVLSLTPNGFAPRWASIPFLKGRAKLYRVVLRSGRTVTVTDEHRFLTPAGWHSLRDGLRAGHLLACAENDPCGDPGVDGYALPKNGGNYSQRVADSLDDCRLFSHCDDAQFPEALSSVQEYAPLQAGVPAYSRCVSQRDAQPLLSVHTHRHHNTGHPSKSNYSPMESHGHAVSAIPGGAYVVPPWGLTPQDVLQWSAALGPARLTRATDRDPRVPVDDLSPAVSVKPRHTSVDTGQRLGLLHCTPLQSLVDSRRCYTTGQWPHDCQGECYCVVSSCIYCSRWDWIRSVECVGEDVYYDMYVPGPENYVAEGIVHHNTGTGKGRQIAGIIADNVVQGRTKAVWVSEKAALIEDARRDWVKGVQGKPSDIFTLNKVKPRDPIQSQHGILFVTYDTLKTSDREDATKTRVQQIVNWLGADFDGVLVFDEAHNMANATQHQTARGKSTAAQKALAGLALQQALPHARIVYVSATGATEVSNLAYAERLGLWGAHTPFPNKLDFINQISAGGVAAMELVARDLKALGLYLARSLSYTGVGYQRLEHALTPDQSQAYDMMANAWQGVLQNIGAALQVTGGGSQAKKNALAAFWSAHQQFFNVVLTSLQMPTVLRQMEADLAQGDALVVQLTRTNEATLNRRMAERRDDEEEDFEDVSLTPIDTLMNFVERSFPVAQWVPKVNDDGTETMIPLLDSAGNAVDNPEAVAMRERLLGELATLNRVIPDPPLEMLLDHFGPDQVAEMTARKQRLVYQEDADGVRRRVKESRSRATANADVADFMADRKRILIFSEAGGTGRSYHADKDAVNQRKRKHYLVQAGWRADKALQGLGRTHRTNEATPPLYYLVTTDLPGHKRFVATIARRLDQLGALTRGQRQAAQQGMFGEKDNLESDLAHGAMVSFFRDLFMDKIPEITLDDYEQQTGLSLRNSKGNFDISGINIPQFLNRLLSMTIAGQNAVFSAFNERLDQRFELAMQQGTLHTGVETIKADRIEKATDEVIATDDQTGAETHYIQLRVSTRRTPTSWQTLNDHLAMLAVGGGSDDFVKMFRGFWRNNQSGRLYAVVGSHYHTTDNGSVVPMVRRFGTDSTDLQPSETITEARYTKLSPGEAQQVWETELASLSAFRDHTEHLVTGLLLPHWDKLPRGGARVYRVETDQGERFIGRVLAPSTVKATLQNFGKATNAEGESVKPLTPHEAVTQILEHNAQLRLSNGWTLKRSRIGGTERLELTGPDYRHMDELQADGVLYERVGYTPHFFLPTGDNTVEVLGRITETRPIVEQIGGDASVHDEEVPYTVDEEASPYGIGLAPIFYAKARQVIEQKMPRQAPAHQVLRLLDPAKSGVKQEELRWSGLPVWLTGQSGMVTRQQVLDYLDAHQVEVQPQIQGGQQPLVWDTAQGTTGQLWTPRGLTGYGIIALPNGYYLARTAGGLQSSFPTLEAAQAEITNAVQNARRDMSPTRYSDYTLPGLQHATYREVQLTLPSRETALTPTQAREIVQQGGSVIVRGTIDGDPVSYDVDTLADLDDYADLDDLRLAYPSGDEPYYHSHFPDIANPVAHIRMDDRTDAQGRNLLFLEEVQSDWQREFRQHGEKPDVDAAQQHWNATAAAFWQALAARGRPRLALLEAKRAASRGELDPDVVPLLNAWDDAESALSEASRSRGVPAAPFITTQDWYQLPLKWALRYAAEHGYDGIGWTTGTQQQDRYSLRTHVRAIGYDAADNALYLYPHDGGGPRLVDVPRERLAEYIGAANAEKILQQPLTKGPNLSPQHMLTDLDMEVGGQWATALYDRMLPTFLNRYTKPWGGRVAQTTLDDAETRQAREAGSERFAIFRAGHYVDSFLTRSEAVQALDEGRGEELRDLQEGGESIHVLPITDALRDTVLRVGQPLFEPGARPYGLRDDVTQLALFGGTRALDAALAAGQNARVVPGPRGGPRWPGGLRGVPAGDIRGRAIADPAVIRDLRTTGAAAFYGRPLVTAADVATLGQLVRDPRMERLFWIFTADNTVVDVQVVSSRMPASSTVFPGFTPHPPADMDRMRSHIAALRHAYPGKEIGLTFLHNHPSGNPTPSDQDVSMTRRLAKSLPVIRHIVIDSGGKYTTMDVQRNFAPVARVVYGYEQDPFLTPAQRHPLLGAPIKKDEDVLALGQQLQTPGGTFPVFYRSNKGAVRGIEMLSASDITTLLQHERGQDVLRKILKNRLRSFGAVGAIAYLPRGTQDLLNLGQDLLATGLLEDVVSDETSLRRQLPRLHGSMREPIQGYQVEESPEEKAG